MKSTKMELTREFEKLLSKTRDLHLRNETYLQTMRPPASPMSVSTTLSTDSNDDDIDEVENDVIDVSYINLSDDATWLCKEDCDEVIEKLDDAIRFMHQGDDQMEDARYHTRRLMLNHDLVQLSKTANNNFVDSRTFTRPKKKMNRPSLESINSTFKYSYSKTPCQEDLPANSSPSMPEKSIENLITKMQKLSQDLKSNLTETKETIEPDITNRLDTIIQNISSPYKGRTLENIIQDQMKKLELTSPKISSEMTNSIEQPIVPKLKITEKNIFETSMNYESLQGTQPPSLLMNISFPSANLTSLTNSECDFITTENQPQDLFTSYTSVATNLSEDHYDGFQSEIGTETFATEVQNMFQSFTKDIGENRPIMPEKAINANENLNTTIHNIESQLLEKSNQFDKTYLNEFDTHKDGLDFVVKPANLDDTITLIPQTNETITVFPTRDETITVFPRTNETITTYPQTNETITVIPQTNETITVSPKTNQTITVSPKTNETITVSPKAIMNATMVRTPRPSSQYRKPTLNETCLVSTSIERLDTNNDFGVTELNKSYIKTESPNNTFTKRPTSINKISLSHPNLSEKGLVEHENRSLDSTKIHSTSKSKLSKLSRPKLSNDNLNLVEDDHRINSTNNGMNHSNHSNKSNDSLNLSSSFSNISSNRIAQHTDENEHTELHKISVPKFRSTPVAGKLSKKIWSSTETLSPIVYIAPRESASAKERDIKSARGSISPVFSRNDAKTLNSIEMSNRPIKQVDKHQSIYKTTENIHALKDPQIPTMIVKPMEFRRPSAPTANIQNTTVNVPQENKPENKTSIRQPVIRSGLPRPTSGIGSGIPRPNSRLPVPRSFRAAAEPKPTPPVKNNWMDGCF